MKTELVVETGLIMSIRERYRYNYTGEEYFVKKKDRGFRHVTSTARLITQEALPIRCVDAVFLGAYLTAEMADVREGGREVYYSLSNLDSTFIGH